MEKLRIDNPYAGGTIIEFDDGELYQRAKEIPYKIDNTEIAHIVSEYDSLDTIAFHYYGNSKLFWVIAIANGIIDPFTLIAGTSILIPNWQNFQSKYR